MWKNLRRKRSIVTSFVLTFLLLPHIFSLKTQFILATLVSIFFSSPSLHHFSNFNREKDIESDKRRFTRKMKSWRIRRRKMKTRKKNYTASGTKMGQGFKVHAHSRNSVHIHTYIYSIFYIYICVCVYVCVYTCIKGLRIFFDCRIKEKKDRVKINIERRKPSIRWPVRGFFIAFRDKAHAKDQKKPSKRFFVGGITWLSSANF